MSFEFRKIIEMKNKNLYSTCGSTLYFNKRVMTKTEVTTKRLPKILIFCFITTVICRVVETAADAVHKSFNSVLSKNVKFHKSYFLLVLYLMS